LFSTGKVIVVTFSVKSGYFRKERDKAVSNLPRRFCQMHRTETFRQSMTDIIFLTGDRQNKSPPGPPPLPQQKDYGNYTKQVSAIASILCHRKKMVFGPAVL